MPHGKILKTAQPKNHLPAFVFYPLAGNKRNLISFSPQIQQKEAADA